MHRRREWLLRGGLLAALALAPVFGHAQAEEAPDALIKRLSDDVLGAVKADATLKTGDISRLMALVDTKVMPSVNFQRMTAGAVGPAGRHATPEQRTRLQEEFKTLLVRTYAGAVAQVSDQTVTVKPLRAGAGDTEVVVRTEVRGRGEPIQLDYRLEKTPGQGAGWKIYNLNVLGVWLMETYRSQFAQEINARGIDGLIMRLAERNRAGNAAARKG
jgi:phospholipid transport system substrate-binding protein